MQAGGVTITDAYDVSGRVLIDGRDIGADVETVSIGRDIPSGLPGDSGFTSASGRVTATWGDDVSDRVDHPWSADPVWPPRPNAAVEVRLSDGTGEWTQFKGVIVDPSGSLSSRTISFGVRDNYRSLDRLVTLPSLSDQMPSLVDTNDYRHIGLQTPFITDWVLRQAGRYATPPQSGGCVVSATLMGSSWAERGLATASIKNTPDEFSNNSPNWRTTDYGLCAHNLNAEYEPYLWSGLSGRLTDAAVELTQEVVQPSDGATYLRARFGGGGRVALVFSNTRIQARYYHPSGGSETLLATPTKTGRTRVTARFTLVGQWLEVEMRTRRTNGQIVSEGTASYNVGHGPLTGPISDVWANGDGAQGAFQVSFPSTAWIPLRSTPNAVIHAAHGGRNWLRGLPTQVNVNALDLLNDQADAEFAQWWIDEHDVLQWWDRGLLAQQPIVGELTSQDHVQDMSWSQDADSARHSVHVHYKHPEITQRWRTTLVLWQGGNTTLDQGDEDEQFINVPDDEIWLGVDWEDPIWYSRTTSWWGAVNRGIKTVLGGIAVDDDGERLTNSILPSIRRITDAAYVITTNITSLSGDEQAALQFPDDGNTDPELWARWLGEKLPIVRGKKKVLLVDDTYTSELTGPDSAPDFTHDVGWWIQDDGYAGRTADYAAASLTQPRPRVDGLDVMPVLALQVGDRIRVQMPDVAELELTGVVTSNNLDANLAAGTIQQSISIMPTNVHSTAQRWRDFGHVFGGTQWGTWAKTTTNETWSDFGDTPLR